MPIITHLTVDQFGSFIHKTSERLKVTLHGQIVVQAPLMHLQVVLVYGDGISLSTDTITACCERGIPIHFLDARGHPIASLHSPGLGATVLTRREQYRAYDDTRGFRLAQAFASGKLVNQAVTLRYLARTRKTEQVAEDLRRAAYEVLDAELAVARAVPEHVDQARASLMAHEARGARVYWDAVRQLVPVELNWTARETRGASDAVNAMLNYAYGILYTQVEQALLNAGLDPYAGFIHADRPGKPSLTCDLIEEFRQTAVDRVVLGLLGQGFRPEQDTEGRLTVETRQTLADHVLKHLESAMRLEGERTALRICIQRQARQLAAYLRGEREAYQPFKAEG